MSSIRRLLERSIFSGQARPGAMLVLWIARVKARACSACSSCDLVHSAPP
jgi:hypothetical protein